MTAAEELLQLKRDKEQEQLYKNWTPQFNQSERDESYVANM